MSYAVLALGLIIFVVLIRQFSILQKVREAGHDTREAVLTMRNPALDDDRKEALVQRAAARTAGAFLDILARCLIALAAPVLLVVAGWQLDLYSLNAALAASADPIAWVVLTVLAVLIWRIAR